MSKSNKYKPDSWGEEDGLNDRRLIREFLKNGDFDEVLDVCEYTKKVGGKRPVKPPITFSAKDSNWKREDNGKRAFLEEEKKEEE